MRTLGVVTARGGSKSVPGKNLKLLAGKPLIAYTIEAAQKSGAFDRIVLSTDEPAIADAARALSCEVPFLRPPELARDDTPHLPVMQHAVGWLRDSDQYEPDLVMILQPTSPLRSEADIHAAIDLIVATGADSVVSV
jgi:CMP-N-acetylneuraminic acid synthetase